MLVPDPLPEVALEHDGASPVVAPGESAQSPTVRGPDRTSNINHSPANDSSPVYVRKSENQVYSTSSACVEWGRRWENEHCKSLLERVPVVCAERIMSVEAG